MATLRSRIDPEERSVFVGPTSFRTQENEFEIRCGMCGKINYVDGETFERINSAIQAGLDNPFCCEVCEEEYDDLSYEG